MNRTRIVIAGAAPEAEPRYLLVDELGSIVGRGILPVQEASALTPMRTVLVIPGAETSVRWLKPTGASEAQARAAALLSLQDELAQAGEALHLALGPPDETGERAACVLAASRLQAALDQARRHGVSPDVVIPDHLALPPPPGGEGVRLADLGDRWAARGARLAVSGEAVLVEAVIGEAAVERLGAEAAERLLAQGAQAPGLNLMQGAFDPARREQLRLRDLRRLAILGALVLISPVLLTGAQALSDHLKAQAAEARTAELAASLLPPGETLTDPAAQVEARHRALAMSVGGGGAALLAQIYAVLEPMPQAQLENFILLPDGTARAAVSLAAHSDLERLTTQARQSGLSLRDEGFRDVGGRVVVDLILGAR